MRPLLTLLTTVVLGAGLSACGAGQSASTHTTSSAAVTVTVPATSTATPTQGADTSGRNTAREREVRNFGHAASPADRRAVTALVKRYYTIALAGKGAAACALIYITLAEAVVEDYGRESAGPSYMRSGTTCPAVMTLLFAHEHAQLAAELPRLKVVSVRLQHNHGLAVLSFGRGPERQINVRQQAGKWKVDALLDSQIS